MADLSVCDTCGGVEGHRATCPAEEPFVARRAKEARDKADLEALAQLRAHPSLFSVILSVELGIEQVFDKELDAHVLLLDLLRGAKPEGGKETP